MHYQNLSLYGELFIGLAVILSGLISARIASFLCARWRLRGDVPIVMLWVAVAIAVVLAYHISIVANLTGGAFYGLAAVVVCPLSTAVLWGYLVAGTRVIEQLIDGLENRMSAK